MEKNREPINILINRTKARFCERNLQIFFQEKRDPVTGQRLAEKEPVTLFIDNAGTFNEYPLECIECLEVQLGNPSWSFLCDNRIKISIPFKIFILAKFSDQGSYELILLPDDIGVKVTTLYDLSEKQISRSLYQTMQRVGNTFVYTIIIPVDRFTGFVPVGQDFSVITRLTNMTWNAEIGEVCFCGTGSPPAPATRVDLSIFYDLLVQIAVEQELTVMGEVE
mgnify:CR=1 FL=1